jgi:hypothetical protein
MEGLAITAPLVLTATADAPSDGTIKVPLDQANHRYARNRPEQARAVDHLLGLGLAGNLGEPTAVFRHYILDQALGEHAEYG